MMTKAQQKERLVRMAIHAVRCAAARAADLSWDKTGVCHDLMLEAHADKEAIALALSHLREELERGES